jgi:hypothetical protein
MKELINKKRLSPWQPIAVCGTNRMKNLIGNLG